MPMPFFADAPTTFLVHSASASVPAALQVGGNHHHRKSTLMNAYSSGIAHSAVVGTTTIQVPLLSLTAEPDLSGASSQATPAAPAITSAVFQYHQP
jgi:hypothetical protein